MRYRHTLDQWHNAICCIPDCDTTIPWNAPVPTCRPHGLEIAREYRDVLRHEERVERAQHEVAIEEKRPAEMRRAGREVVYYVRIGDYIKIGYTRRLRERMRQLRVSFDDLLAVEDGDRTIEADRHREFRADRIHTRRENFRASEALLDHIASLGGRGSLPDWARHPDTATIRMTTNGRAIG